MLEIFKVNYLNEDKGCKVINPDGLDADNGGKPITTGGLGK